MADAVIEELYRSTFADRLITPDENAELISTLQDLQAIQDGSSTPPALTPDKLVWLRAAAFRIACEYLVEDGGDDARGENVKLLKTVNAVVSIKRAQFIATYSPVALYFILIYHVHMLQQ